MASSFPGFKACLAMMRKHDPQTMEDGFHLLREHVSDFVDELVAELRAETAHGLRCWLLELLGEARSANALPVFEEYLQSDDESLRNWAAVGLHKLGSRDARRTLFVARSLHCEDAKETQRFHQLLEDLQAEHAPRHGSHPMRRDAHSRRGKP
jgi:hypothetical protein